MTKDELDKLILKLPELAEAFTSVGADEGTLWLLSDQRDALLPAWNSGPNASAIVGDYQQPLTTGLISFVCISEQAICENSVYRNASQDPTLDRKLSLLTCSMIAVPLKIRGEVHGVVSCVKLKAPHTPEDPPPFSADDLAAIARKVEELTPHLAAP